jgi:hypothetical protein
MTICRAIARSSFEVTDFLGFKYLQFGLQAPQGASASLRQREQRIFHIFAPDATAFPMGCVDAAPACRQAGLAAFLGSGRMPRLLPERLPGTGLNGSALS